MKYIPFRLFFAMFFVLPFFLVAQKDTFNHFETTKSVGKPPAIFTTPFKDKVASQIESATDIDSKDKEEYAKYTSYALNNLLNSGRVLYGDPMTLYVQKVAKKLLEKEYKLKRELQFFVIKTNATRTLCFEPGIIFIPTGLLSQIENEAQLAYLLAREIMHYQLKHQQKSFDPSNKSKINPTTAYQEVAYYSKEQESEVDIYALKLYQTAGYSEMEVMAVFDVLMYDYLPFGERIIDSSFFGNPTIYIPPSYFPKQAHPIATAENYDNSKSNHINIKERKRAVKTELGEYDGWKKEVYFLKKEIFKKIQNIARFESVRENILTANYVEALYAIYLLEKEFPDNKYLQTMKALSWASMSQVSLEGGKEKLTENFNEKEGSISKLYGFIQNLNQEELAILSVRQVEDVFQQFSQSERLKKIKTESIASLAHSRNFKIKKLERMTYYEAKALRQKQKNDTVSKAKTSRSKRPVVPQELKAVKGKNHGGGKTKLFDKNFSFFLLHDLIGEKAFNETFKAEKEKIIKSKVIRFENEEQKLKDDDKLEGDILLLSPRLEAKRKGEFDLDETFLFYEYLNENIEKFAPQEKLNNRDVSKVKEFSTERYNELSTLMSFLMQRNQSSTSEFKNLWVDYNDIQNLLKKYSDPNVVLINGQYYYNKFTDKAVTGNTKFIKVSTGKIYSTRQYESRHKLSNAAVKGLAHITFLKFE